MENFEMSMRDQIAQRLAAADRDQRPYPETADAILAALPDMIAPLVWGEDKYGDFYAYSGAFGYRVGFEKGEGWFVSLSDTDVLHTELKFSDTAQAAANAHHRAAFKTILTGDQP
jgi:hypothetical protein